MLRIITSGESYVYSYNKETKQKSLQRTDLSLKTEEAAKNMLVVFFDIHRVVHPEFFSQGQTVKAKHFCGILSCLREYTECKPLGMPQFSM